MRVNGLTLIYKDGINTVLSNNSASYPVGDLLCRIFQGETLYNISRIVRNCVSVYPMRDILLSQDEIEQAEDYILQSLMYDEFYPARRLSQGSFIRCIEEYRSLDSASQSRLIQEEKQRAEMGGQFFKDIGFNTIGEFLQLCFNNYYVDLINGTSLFTETSAVWSGTATEEERALYDELCEALQDPHAVPPTAMEMVYDVSSGTFGYRYVISSFLGMAVFEFSHLAESATKIVRCQNPVCGKFFTAKRASAKYCGNPAPQCPGRVCSDYYPQLLHREKVRADELDQLIKNAKGRLYNAKRRHPEQAEVIDEQLNDLTIYSPVKKQEVLDNAVTISEFREWLDSHKN